jgi:hypothetical protein
MRRKEDTAVVTGLFDAPPRCLMAPRLLMAAPKEPPTPTAGDYAGIFPQKQRDLPAKTLVRTGDFAAGPSVDLRAPWLDIQFLCNRKLAADTSTA